MFVIRFFVKSFQFSKIFSSLGEKFWKYIVYGILLIFIANFPSNFQIVKEEGSRLDFLIEDFSIEAPINWDLPDNIEIIGGKLVNNGDSKEYINSHKGKTYIINKIDEKIDKGDYLNHVILFEDSILYIDSEGNFLEGFGYKGFSMEIFRFNDINDANYEDSIIMYQSLAKSLEKSFSSQIVLYTLIRNMIVNLVVNFIYILLLAGLVMFFKFGFQNFINYFESIRLVILCLTLPAVITFLIGLLSFAFAPVLFQLASGMTVMLVLLVFSKKNFS